MRTGRRTMLPPRSLTRTYSALVDDISPQGSDVDKLVGMLMNSD